MLTVSGLAAVFQLIAVFGLTPFGRHSRPYDSGRHSRPYDGSRKGSAVFSREPP